MTDKNTVRCSVCGREITRGDAPSAEPVAKGVCCDDCFIHKVFPAKLEELRDEIGRLRQRAPEFDALCSVNVEHKIPWEVLEKELRKRADFEEAIWGTEEEPGIAKRYIEYIAAADKEDVEDWFFVQEALLMLDEHTALSGVLGMFCAIENSGVNPVVCGAALADLCAAQTYILVNSRHCNPESFMRLYADPRLNQEVAQMLAQVAGVEVRTKSYEFDGNDLESLVGYARDSGYGERDVERFRQFIVDHAENGGLREGEFEFSNGDKLAIFRDGNVSHVGVKRTRREQD